MSQPAHMIGMLSVMSLLLGRESCGNHVETTAKPWLLDVLLWAQLQVIGNRLQQSNSLLSYFCAKAAL